MFDDSEFAEPFPGGVDQSVEALACKPDAVPVPMSAAIPDIVVELVRSAGGFVSNVHWVMMVA